MLRRDPSGDLQEIATGLEFANGVALASDESFLAVAETGAGRILRIEMTPGAGAGGRERFADNLPGLPDNLSTGADGTIWAALAHPAQRPSVGCSADLMTLAGRRSFRKSGVLSTRR